MKRRAIITFGRGVKRKISYTLALATWAVGVRDALADSPYPGIGIAL